MINIGNIEAYGLWVGNKMADSAYVGIVKVWEKSAPLGDSLCFTGTQGDSVRMTKVGSPDSANIEYSKDGRIWTAYTFGTWIGFDGTDNKVYFRAASDNDTSFYTDDNNRYKFELDENYPTTISGNIDILLNKNGTRHITKAKTYRELFAGMSGLTNASQLELPSDSMTLQCYYGMFQNCTALVAAPALPATTLASSCYRIMFSGCTSLTSAPSLSVTTLADYCYYSMFYGCSALTTAPTLPATTLTSNCYASMFSSCSNLSSITLGYTGNFADAPSNAFNNWVNGVAASGTFYYDGTDTTTGVSAIPTGWTVLPITSRPELCFTAEEANSTVAMAANGSAPEVSLECSTDGSTWSPFVVDTTIVTLANIGDKVYVRATSAGNYRMAASTSKYNKFVMSGKIAASGNVDTLLDQNGNATLTSYCYSNLFSGCVSLTTAPALPATTLSTHCYFNMFYGCTSLTTAPALPATSLSGATNCYYGMFQGCTSLTTEPALPATTLAKSCYFNMFRSCTSLTTAPELPATTLAGSCYSNMFRDCSNLNTIKLGYTGNFSSTNFSGWVTGVAASGTFYYNGSDTTIGQGAIPTGWTVTPFTP